VRVDGQTRWNWVFQNDDVVIPVIRASRGAGVVGAVLDEHRPAIWVSDLYGAQQGHAEGWQVCLAHQLRDCQDAIEAGDSVFAPRMKALLLRAVVLARRHRDLTESTRREYRRRLERDLNAVMVLAPTQRDGRRLRKRYAKLREYLFTFLSHPEVTADNNGSERELRPTATYRKVTGGFHSNWRAAPCSPLSDPSSAPLNGAALTPIRLSAIRYTGRPRSQPVEQLPQIDHPQTVENGAKIDLNFRAA
jgi:transposase